MEEIYAPFVRSGKPIIRMSNEAAEITKYAANAMLATRISFMNEVANLCRKVGASVDRVRKGIGSDGRIGSKFLHAGVGYGGSCLPKDVTSLIHLAREKGYEPKIIAVARPHHLLWTGETVTLDGSKSWSAADGELKRGMCG